MLRSAGLNRFFGPQDSKPEYDECMAPNALIFLPSLFAEGPGLVGACLHKLSKLAWLR